MMTRTRRQRLQKIGLVVSSLVTLSTPLTEGVKLLVKEAKATRGSRKLRVAYVPAKGHGFGSLAKRAPRRIQLPADPLSPVGRFTALDAELLLTQSWVNRPSRLFINPPASTTASRYPWKCQVATTVFWIGEPASDSNPTPNHQSSWDENWAENYGGYDEPDPRARRGYSPTGFTPRQNPFYVALPYNDLCHEGHKTEASQVIPWYKAAFVARNKSVCKDRWIAIRRGGKICYAQWEDAGPNCADDAAYVFGSSRPKSSGAGLDISPAVRDFLGLGESSVTDWRFVDFEEVPFGPWSELGRNNTFVIQRDKVGGPAVAAARKAAAAADRD